MIKIKMRKNRRIYGCAKSQGARDPFVIITKRRKKSNLFSIISTYFVINLKPLNHSTYYIKVVLLQEFSIKKIPIFCFFIIFFFSS